jgi:NADPH:quinone reductase-like Zn-dependent oxidoreductase
MPNAVPMMASTVIGFLVPPDGPRRAAGALASPGCWCRAARLRSLGAEPVAYGEGLVERARALTPDGVDAALDVAGSGVLPELIELAGGPEHVVTIADFGGAQEHGVMFSSGDAGRAVHALGEIGELIESGRFSLPVARTFPLAEVAEAHRVSEQGHVRGKLVLLVG